MKYLKIYEEFDSHGYESHWDKFTKWLFYGIVRIFGGLNWNKYKK